jgi:hypothetical protein
MKIRTLFNLLEDAQEISTLFSKVETPEQMVSTLERLKKNGAAEFLDSIQTLRLSVEAAYEESLEMGGSLGDGDENGEEENNEDENLLEGLGDEVENSEENKLQEESKS